MSLYDWAMRCGIAATNEQISSVLTIHSKTKEKLASIIAEEILRDDEDETQDLLALYGTATNREKALIDSLFVNLCGWSFGTILQKYIEKEAEMGIQ